MTSDPVSARASRTTCRAVCQSHSPHWRFFARMPARCASCNDVAPGAGSASTASAPSKSPSSKRASPSRIADSTDASILRRCVASRSTPRKSLALRGDDGRLEQQRRVRVAAPVEAPGGDPARVLAAAGAERDRALDHRQQDRLALPVAARSARSTSP